MQFTTLQKDMMQAMKDHDKVKKDALSALVSATKKLAIDSGCRDDIPDSMTDQAILKEIKTISRSIHVQIQGRNLRQSTKQGSPYLRNTHRRCFPRLKWKL